MTPQEIEALNARVAACTQCRLHETRTLTVPGDGDPNAELMFIGEGPGANEDRQGHPFVGQSGKVLDQLLAEIDLKRADVFVTNVVKCRPPGNRDPERDEIASCEPYLREHLRGIRPKMIVTLGRFAMQYYIPGASISRAHGRPVRTESQLIYPVYHPAAALRQRALMQVLREDFRRIPELLADTERPPIEALSPEPNGGNDATQLPLL